MAWKLCSKADIYDIHPITESELRDSWSDMVEGLIAQYLGSSYLGISQVITGERHDGDGTNILKPINVPIKSVEAIRVSSDLITSGGYLESGYMLSPNDYAVFPTFVELGSGLLFPHGALNISIDYTTDDHINQAVRLAAVSMIVAIINYRRRAGSDGSLKWGNADVKAGEETMPNSGLTSHLSTIMRRTLFRPRALVR